MIVLALSLLIPASLFGQKPEPWRQWLDEVEPIISRAETEVFRSLKTEEDRTRFIDAFWRARDPNPESPRNEYKLDYYKRLNYAKDRLHGIRSARGRIYMLLGEPFERSGFSGVEQLVECELWTYRFDDRAGLPPVVQLIFYKRADVGDFELFYPGMHTALDILSPGFRTGRITRQDAYTEILKSYPQLAHATLSVLPGEGSPNVPASSAASNLVFAQIFSLPEKEAAGQYLRNFGAVKGVVDTYSAREIAGFGYIAISENRGYRFLNFAMMPDAIHTVKVADNAHSADLRLTCRVSDREGRTVFQKDRTIQFRLTDDEQQALEARKTLFRDFLPVIDGDFDVSVVFLNETAKEYFSHEEKIAVTAKAVPVLFGYRALETSSGGFEPFSTSSLKVLTDPRLGFNKSDSLVGIVKTRTRPRVQLTRLEDDRQVVEVTDIEDRDGVFIFRHPFVNAASDYYSLTVKVGEAEVCRTTISIFPMTVEKPRVLEWSDPPSSGSSYLYQMAQQRLNSDDVPAAMEGFSGLPGDFWTAQTIPVLARAYYRQGDYAKVIELLEREEVKKDFAVLFMLGNSCLELKRLKPAGDYFERLRNYGDTAQINQVLGAIFLAMGEREKAAAYFDRAKKLQEASGNERPGRKP